MKHNVSEENRELYQNIAPTVKNGEYFKDSLDWYYDKFVSPTTHRSFFIFITTISVFIVTVSISVLLSFLPLVSVEPLAVDVQDKSKFYAQLRYIGEVGVKPQTSVINYLATHYVKLRESYDYTKIQRDLDFVEKYSNEFVFKDYVKFMRPESNSKSPVLRYRNHTARNIKPIEVALLPRKENDKLGSGQHRVAVKFEATEKGSLKTKKDIYLANMVIRFTDVKFFKDKKEFTPIDFQVKKYKVTLLEQ